jgi:hypothetical protein
MSPTDQNVSGLTALVASGSQGCAGADCATAKEKPPVFPIGL